MTVRYIAAFAALLPALLIAVACNGDDDDATPTTAATNTAPAATATSGATPTVETGTPGTFTGGTSPVTAPPPAGLQQALLRTMRAAAQTGFDRLVFEFDGTQVPGYTVKYDTKAILCGSGQDVTDFVGNGSAPDAMLIVDMRPAAGHDQAGNVTAQRDLLVGLGTIGRAFRICDFEGVVQYAVALTAEKPFKVSTLTNPPRLVIDVGQ